MQPNTNTTFFSERTKLNLMLKLFGLRYVPLLLFANPSVVAIDGQKVVVKIPLNWRTKNHLGSMYFGALAIGADCAAGLLAIKYIREGGAKVHLSFKNLQANFIKRPESDVYFSNEQGEQIAALVSSVIAQKGVRQELALNISAKCQGEEVANFVLTLSLKCNA